jgi:hypothetical protein
MLQQKKDVDARDISAFTRVFDALCAGMTEQGALLSNNRKEGAI